MKILGSDPIPIRRTNRSSSDAHSRLSLVPRSIVFVVAILDGHGRASGSLLRVAAFVTIAAFVILGLAPASPAAAAGFCENTVAHNYAQPLEEMPALRPVPADRELSFGPRSIHLFPHASQVVLAEQAGRVGYTLKIPPKSSKSGNPNLPLLNWLVTAKLARVDSRGRTRELLGSRRGRVTGPGNNGSFGLELPGEPGYYRVEIVFRNGAGKRLGRFGEYVRVVPSVSDARLTLNATSFRPGEAVSACLENYGTTTVSFGSCGISIESFDASSWQRSSIDPPRECAGVLLALGAGRAAYAGNFDIPSDAPPGAYRASIDGSPYSEFVIEPTVS